MGFGSDKSEMGSAWPLELRFDKKQGKLKLAYDDGFKGDIPFELLRVESPSAETRGHGGEMPPPPAGKKSVGVTSAQPVGRYAVCIEFDDGHATGPANIRKVGLEQGAQQLSPNWQPVLFCLFGIGPAVIQAELGARR